MSKSAASSPTTPSEADVRPIVAIRRRDNTVWLFAGVATVAAILLFMALDARRQALTEASSPASTSPDVRPEQVPELVVPEPTASIGLTQNPGAWPLPYQTRPVLERTAPAFASPSAVGGRSRQSQPQPAPYTPPYSQAPMVISELSGSAVPILGPASQVGEPGRPTGAQAASARVMASRFDNPSMTVPLGTLISAVLESALDSTGAGQVRAIVTRDVHGFDGSRLLIPRGTRLYGSYEAEIAQGQNRAQVRWTRLLRPDGVIIALDSPAADPLGRAGVKGKVDNHFIQRLGNALLSSTVNIGTALATRRAGPVIVAVPSAGQATANLIPQDSTQIKPTLRVKQGTRVSVFVQHDLDFSSVETAQ